MPSSTKKKTTCSRSPKNPTCLLNGLRPKYNLIAMRCTKAITIRSPSSTSVKGGHPRHTRDCRAIPLTTSALPPHPRQRAATIRDRRPYAPESFSLWTGMPNDLWHGREIVSWQKGNPRDPHIGHQQHAYRSCFGVLGLKDKYQSNVWNKPVGHS